MPLFTLLLVPSVDRGFTTISINYKSPVIYTVCLRRRVLAALVNGCWFNSIHAFSVNPAVQMKSLNVPVYGVL